MTLINVTVSKKFFKNCVIGGVENLPSDIAWSGVWLNFEHGFWFLVVVVWLNVNHGFEFWVGVKHKGLLSESCAEGRCSS